MFMTYPMCVCVCVCAGCVCVGLAGVDVCVCGAGRHDTQSSRLQATVLGGGVTFWTNPDNRVCFFTYFNSLST